ncbi:ATP-binding cassette domain-containing protein [Chitinophaga polysaccharea]|uniref:ABC transporter ATP-binding protein n=1 Tax=Chitinophaga TaxID=79328 RepID=UPI001455CAA2|nr:MULTISPECIES: ATP-binding cassette domain-containing protein [Chitinophaga]NLR61471.1 ATP-binding cassette domain-containing protein [Chitinophaga polysaccharea]NLU95308.1 ATP-binding cassette domain-containing protein [Chitinophaga sp. Ak27]
MSALIAEINHLHHTFNQHKVLEDLNLQIPAGSVYGILGPNGAGKTTTLFLLLGLLRLQAGRIRIFDKDIATHRVAILQQVGSLIEQPSLYGHLTGRENLDIFRRCYHCHKERIRDVLQQVELTEAAHQLVKTYSLGMKQRLAIAIALLSDPALLILDEPTNGLDPAGIIAMRSLVKTLNEEQGKTIILSSHLLGEVEKMATQVAIIRKGRLLYEGVPHIGQQSLEELFIQLTAAPLL